MIVTFHTVIFSYHLQTPGIMTLSKKGKQRSLKNQKFSHHFAYEIFEFPPIFVLFFEKRSSRMTHQAKRNEKKEKKVKRSNSFFISLSVSRRESGESEQRQTVRDTSVIS